MKKVLYIPEGLVNLQSLFPLVDYDNIEEWNVQVKDVSGNVIATTRTNKLSCCCTSDKIRIHFVNSIGELDSMNFNRGLENEDIKSSSWESALSFPLDRTAGGSNRQGIKSNESTEAENNCYPENAQYWVKELFETPRAWLEMLLPNGFSDPTVKEYIPIVIQDGKFAVRKVKERYEYVVLVKFSMANSNINLR